jgi:hypothetical protein
MVEGCERSDIAQRSFGVMKIESSDRTLCGEAKHPQSGNQERLRVSYWRHAYYDVVFGLREDTTGKPIEIWSAQRQPDATPTPASDTRELINKEWKVELCYGIPSAKNRVKLKKLHWPKLKGELFLLYHYKKISPPSKPAKYSWLPFDILSYDAGVGSFNSIFGFRSLDYRPQLGSKEACVFATFNSLLFRRIMHLLKHEASKVILLETLSAILGMRLDAKSISKILRTKLDSNHQIGQLMDFEKLSQTSIEEGEGDQDIGVWDAIPG